MSGIRTDQKCSFAGCKNNRHARDLCTGHYKQWRIGRPLTPFTYRRLHPCSFVGCDKPVNARELCSAHYSQWKRTGSTWEIGSRFQNLGLSCDIEGCDRKAVSLGICSSHRRHMEKYGEARVIKPIAPAGSGTVRSTDGYRFVQRANDPYYPGEAVGEHRLVMAHMIGRRLLGHENVHHINGDRLDNRAANLELWSSSQPPGQRVQDKVAWAREIIALYGEW